MPFRGRCHRLGDMRTLRGRPRPRRAVDEGRALRPPTRGPRAPRVFISYRREDAAPYAGRLYDALTGRFGNDNVVMDLDTIELGTDYTEAIDRAIATSDAVRTAGLRGVR
jgi:hypothetical protein